MSEQDRISFENWYISEYCKGLSEISINEVMAKNSLGVYSSFHVNGAYSGWQAAKTHYEETWLIDNEKKILALESEIAELSRDLEEYKASTMFYCQQNEELQASNNDLREFIENNCANKSGKEVNGNRLSYAAKELLSATPAESLQAHDDELIEKCAKVCDHVNQQYADIFKDTKDRFNDGASYGADDCAESIRDLKGK